MRLSIYGFRAKPVGVYVSVFDLLKHLVCVSVCDSNQGLPLLAAQKEVQASCSTMVKQLLSLSSERAQPCDSKKFLVMPNQQRGLHKL